MFSVRSTSDAEALQKAQQALCDVHGLLMDEVPEVRSMVRWSRDRDYVG